MSMRSAVLAILLLTATTARANEPTVVHLFGPEDPVVAQIDGQPLLLSELESGLRATVIRTLFDLDRRLADEVDSYVMEALLAREAAAAGMTIEGWIDWKIDERVWPVTLSEAKQHFRTAGYPQGTKFGAVREQIIAQLTTQRRAGARTVVLDEARARHQVTVMIEPFRLDLASSDDPALGPAGAPVTIVEFSDFQCPYCARARVTVKELTNRYPNRVRLIARDFPLPMHGLAAPMAEAAGCAAEQGGYWPYADALFERYRTLQQEDLPVLAAELGLDPHAFRTCLDSGHQVEEVANDVQEGQIAGVTGTPTFFINGRMISGAQPIESFIEIVEEELAE
jgi:protein-disulfide isomerase